MKKKRFNVEQIVGGLKQAEVGVPVVELIRKVGISEPTIYFLGSSGIQVQESSDEYGIKLQIFFQCPGMRAQKSLRNVSGC
jgi:hypothetical protein